MDDDFYEEDEPIENIQAAWNRAKKGRTVRIARRFRWRAFRSRLRLMWRALSGKPMVIVRGNLIVSDADFHGGIWFDSAAHDVEIRDCHIQDGPQAAIWFDRKAAG